MNLAVAWWVWAPAVYLVVVVPVLAMANHRLRTAQARLLVGAFSVVGWTVVIGPIAGWFRVVAGAIAVATATTSLVLWWRARHPQEAV